MGYQVSDQAQNQEHTNQTAYVGNDVFGPLLKQLANQYGTQQAATDLIFGGKQYGKARTFMPDRYRDLSASEAQSVLAAGNTNQATKKMPSYKDDSGNVWTWDAKSNIYIGYAPDKDNRYTEKIGAWSPYDKDHTTPPWKQGLPPDAPPNSGGVPPGGTGGGGGSTTPPPSTNPGGGGGGTIPPGGGPGGGGPDGGEHADTGGGSTNPQTGRPWGVSRRVPGVGRADEQGLTGLGVRTESPSTGATITPPGPKGWDAVEANGREEFRQRFGELITGHDAHFREDVDPFSYYDRNDRDNWITTGSSGIMDQRTLPDSAKLTTPTGKSAPTSDLASQHPATFRQAMDRINESPDYYKNPGAFREPLAQGTASEGGDWLNMKRKPEEAAAQDTFAKLLAGLRG